MFSIIVTPCLVGPGDILDDGHAAHAYGTDDALILVRPDGHIALAADSTETGRVAEYLRSLYAFQGCASVWPSGCATMGRWAGVGGGLGGRGGLGWVGFCLGRR